MVLDAYSGYVNNFAKAMDTVKVACRTHLAFAQFLKVSEKGFNFWKATMISWIEKKNLNFSLALAGQAIKTQICLPGAIVHFSWFLN